MTDLLTLIARPDWMRHAACRGLDPDLFHPERGQTADRAKAVCATCPVQPECLDHAFRNGERVGVWGGTSERERRKMRQQWAAEHGIDLRAEMQRRPIDHGTSAGARRCYERPEGACWACRDWISRDREARRMLRRETA